VIDPTIGARVIIAHGYVRATADSDVVARLDKEIIERLAPALSELKARPRGGDADKFDIDPTEPNTLGNGASFAMDVDASPLDFLNDIPGAADFDLMRSRGHLADAGGVAAWVVGFEDLIRMNVACRLRSRTGFYRHSRA
jgi:hypothetical protein